jgi:hypothetical protein
MFDGLIKERTSYHWTKKELLILAFDHRSSFTGKLFGIKGRPPTALEKQEIQEFKRVWGKWKGLAFVYVLNSLPSPSGKFGIDLTHF